MRLMGPEGGGRADVVGVGGGGAHEGSAASPPGSANTNPPPSPSLYDIGDDDATPRQQWSPVHTVGGCGGGGGGGGAKPSRTRGHHGGSSGGGTFAGGGACGEPRAHAGKGGAGDSVWGGGSSARNANNRGGSGSSSSSSSSSTALNQQHRLRVAPPDSPVLRVDLERLDLSVLALGEEGGPTIPADGRAGGAAASSGRNNSELLHSRTFCSEPGGRPRSLGGRPSRAHALFVAPGKMGAGPASPPSSYSTHSESGGFASPTARLASPFGLSSAAGGGGKGEHHHHHHQQQQQQQQHFHHQQGRVKKGHWKKGKPIGVGSCGNVYLGMNEDTGELMAVKEITLETKDRLLTSLYNEIQVMHKLVHPHIVGYLGAELQDSKRKLCIFQEWVPAGSLHSLLGQFGALSDAMTRKYTRQVLEGLVYLHANRVIHRDVKSKNILVDDRGNVKLADFGCALVLKDDNGDGVEMSMKGTPLFMAPEMLLKRKCGKRVDVWSLGCAVLEMVTTRPPWADTFKHPVEIIEHFSENPGPPPLPEDLSPALREFLLSCFTWEAGRRPTSHQLVAHEYLLRDRRLSAGGGGDGTGSSGSGEDNDIPLEAMGRAPFMTRMRRCSSATLPELMQRSHAFGGRAGGGGGGDALAAFGTAPSGTLRPPSPRYGPGGVAAASSKRTPTRRRMYTESSSGSCSSAMPPPEGGGSAKPSVAAAVAAAAAGATAAGGMGGGGVYQAAGGGAPGTGLVRRASMPHAGRSPPVSPEKPRRPGRGSSPGRCSSAVMMQHYHQHHHQHHHHQAEEERLGSGPVGHARLRSMGDGIAGITGFGATTSGSSSSSSGERGAISGSSESVGRTDSEQSVSRSSSSGRGAAPAGGGAGEGHVMRKAAPTPTLPPIVRELLGTLEQGGGLREGEGGLLLHSGDTPPPTVRPLERSASAQTGHPGRGTTGGGDTNPTAKTTLLQQRGKAAGGGRGGEWGISDSRGGGGGDSR
ncbi:unnamed protein product, partial [Ectocarpus fasciculatus]